MPAQRTYLYVGCCTRPTPYYPTHNGKGIAAFTFDEASGAIGPIGITDGIDNPTYLGVDTRHRALHANSEVFGWNEGTVSAYAIDPATGKLSYINKQPSLGSITAYNSLDRSGNFLLVANYSLAPEGELPNKAVAILPVRPDGGLMSSVSDAVHSGTGPVPDRQERSHPHSVLATPDNRYVVVADLGLDLLVAYRFNSQTGAISRSGAASLAPGAGPRHFVFHPRGRFVYVANELDSTVTSFSYEPDQAKFTTIATASTMPEGAATVNHCSEIRISADGAFLYVANRGHDSIAIFALDGDGGLELTKTVPSGGEIPRNFAIDPSGNFLVVANQNSDRVTVFAVDRETGDLTPTGIEVETGTPTSIAFYRTEIEKPA
ncbi:lactonase family protein [Labrys monachus]|uniref:6-phosphogluconolactonase n=1 Tax=Labrys monachus TaxID=217067 RepID=A0ABU0FHF4_9HYPH|nr:lactonase family protein [Labrys monachus]MDQ0393916.1 6-phosphogluconolactonase [Labrys monachus]